MKKKYPNIIIFKDFSWQATPEEFRNQKYFFSDHLDYSFRWKLNFTSIIKVKLCG